tara:strand:- start:674 stop:856 length:183 start_codon:yes stop_codon:yes gene_type:complete
MLRLFLLVILFYGLFLGLNQGWLVVKWSQLFHEVGFTTVDPDKPMQWKQFFIDRLKEDDK